MGTAPDPGILLTGRPSLSPISAPPYDRRVSNPRRIAVLGSTGSIGRQALDVIRQLPDRFEVVALAAGRNADLLAEQVAEFRPMYVTAEAESPLLADAVAATGAPNTCRSRRWRLLRRSIFPSWAPPGQPG